MPSGVRNLLQARLHPISDIGRQLLTTAAVIGRSFGFDLLRAINGRSEEEAIGELDALMGHGLVAEKSEGTDGDLIYDFSHAWLRKLIYEETSQAHRRLLHRRVAETLMEQRGNRQLRAAYMAQIAQHYQLAGRLVEAANYFKQAGDYARGLYANRDASWQHYETALRLGYPEIAALHEALADV